MAELQVEISRDFAPVWGSDAVLEFVSRDGTPDPATWWLAILDDSDNADAVGYHSTTPTGMPLGS